MCLQIIISESPKKTDFGYKVFYSKKPGLDSPYQGMGSYRRHIWLDERDFREIKKEDTLLSSRGEKYPTGFHIWISVADAWAQAHRLTTNCLFDVLVYKVKYTDAQVLGMEDSSVIVVAKKMRILQELRSVGG